MGERHHESAFPALAAYGSSCGMTLRDCFAGQALQAIIHPHHWSAEDQAIVAKRAYEMADAMLAARRAAKPGEGE